MSDSAMKVCFVIMPIGDPKDGTYQRWLNVYENIIKPAVKKYDPSIECFRADEEYRSGEIDPDIIEHVHSDFFCITDVTGRNANVYYELGLRDSWHNRTIMISQDTNDIAFDKGHQRVLPYDENDIKSIRTLEEKISKSLADISKNPEKNRNPVQRFLRETHGANGDSPVLTVLDKGKSSASFTKSKGEPKLAEKPADQSKHPAPITFPSPPAQPLQALGVPDDYISMSGPKFNEKVNNLLYFEGIDGAPDEVLYELYELHFKSESPMEALFMARFNPADSRKVCTIICRDIEPLRNASNFYTVFNKLAKKLSDEYITKVSHYKFYFPMIEFLQNKSVITEKIEKHFANAHMLKNVMGAMGDSIGLDSPKCPTISINLWDVKTIYKLEQKHGLVD